MRVLLVLLLSSSLLPAITLDYPAPGSLFPPDFAPPTFLFRDPSPASQWRIDITFQSGAAPLSDTTAGPPFSHGPIDPRTVAETNRPPELTPQQAATRTWRPAESLWRELIRRAQSQPFTVRFSNSTAHAAVTLAISKDPVAAPIFYRDVPLMPSETEEGVIKPIAAQAISLIQWRLRDLSQPESKVVLSSMPTCGNCHSFSLDGKTLGMDLDGPQNHKGLYALAPVQPEMSIGGPNVVEWSTVRGRLEGRQRLGFMSQVSPDGQFVATTISGAALSPQAADIPSNYYVANFTDYRFLQVFYPTRGILAWYSRATGTLQPLPGADNPDYVHTNAVWTPDGQSLIFARARAMDPAPPGRPLATRANDPNEVQIRYDLYRIPFNHGRGGTPVPIPGASANGMSNSFPKVSPDGRWLVFVQARNGLLMRPDSKLYIVPIEGGTPRRLNSNTPLMNSWHSFSPNSRWLVFSSKARSPYTQMYLTHIDEHGNDSPAILIENSTAANRAVNLPEFVNIPPDGIRRIQIPAVEPYRLFDTALDLQTRGRREEAIAAWRKVLHDNPRHADAHNHLGMVLFETGDIEIAESHFRSALKIRPASLQARCGLGGLLATTGRLDEAITHFRAALATDPNYPTAHSNLGLALLQKNQPAEALSHLRQALATRPNDLPTLNTLGAALALIGRPREAIPHLRHAVQIDANHVPARFNLGLALAAAGQHREALAAWDRILGRHPNLPAVYAQHNDYATALLALCLTAQH